MCTSCPGPEPQPNSNTFEAEASIGFDSFPDHAAPLKARDQWLCSQSRNMDKGKKPRKVPVDPNNPEGYGINATNPANWMPYEEAKRHHDENSLIDYYAFATCEGDPYSFIDVDERIDPMTGEVPPVIMKLVKHLDSYAYVTPNHGVRIVIEGELNDTGGDYVWTDPDTGEEHIFEVYDRKRYLVFTDWVFHDEPIREGQDFLDSLVKKRKSGTNTKGRDRAFDLPEVELPEDLEKARRKIKLLFVKHDLDPGPILEKSRKITLISDFRTIVRNESLEIIGENGTEPDELWKLLTWTNETMLYDESGEQLEGLEEDELREVYDAVTNALPPKAPKEVQEKLDDLWEFLVAIKVRIKHVRDSEWKAMKTLEEHGRKYGMLLSEHEARVDLGQIAHLKQARIGSPTTLQKALLRLERSEIIKRGWDKGNRTRHFVVNLEKAMSPDYWGIEKDFLYAEIYKGDVKEHYSCISLHKGITEKIPKEILEALIHTTWYRQLGPTKIRYLLSILIIERVLEEEATSTRIAEMVGVQPPSVSRPLKELREARIIRQNETRDPYRLSENLADDLYRLRCDKDEFGRDEVAKKKAQDQRRFYRYEVRLGETILRVIEEEGANSDHALKLAKDSILPPRGIDEYDLDNHQRWALNWARREYKRSRGKNGSEQTGRARVTGEDATLRRDIKENYFREGGEDG